MQTVVQLPPAFNDILALLRVMDKPSLMLGIIAYTHCHRITGTANSRASNSRARSFSICEVSISGWSEMCMIAMLRFKVSPLV